MAYIKCCKCGEIIDIPAELLGADGMPEVLPNDPYYCDACEEQVLREFEESDQ